MNRHQLIFTAAVAALTFGLGDTVLTPVGSEPSLSKSDILIAADDTMKAGDDMNDGDTNNDDSESAKMGEEDGTQSGDAADTEDSDTKKVDQPERDESSGATDADQ